MTQRRTILKAGKGESGTVFDLGFLTPRGMLRTGLEWVRTAEIMTPLIPGSSNRLAWQEFQNKLRAFYLFENADSVLDLQGGAGILRALESMEVADSVWVAEGVGRHYADSLQADSPPDRRWLNRDTSAAARRYRVPFHSGMGLALAGNWLRQACRTQPASLETELRSFFALCGSNAEEVFVGILYESLGLACRTQYPEMVPALDEVLLAIDPGMAAYFWHGIGRAFYFLPTAFFPGVRLLDGVLRRAQEEPPHRLGRRNATAGAVWAFTLVNMREPRIMEELLSKDGSRIPDQQAFENGVQSSLVIWRDCAEHDPFLRSFRAHTPNASDPNAARLWRQYISPLDRNAADAYQQVADQGRIGELFRCPDDIDKDIGAAGTGAPHTGGRS